MRYSWAGPQGEPKGHPDRATNRRDYYREHSVAVSRSFSGLKKAGLIGLQQTNQVVLLKPGSLADLATAAV
jgi:hypothetical protein